jgi:hypothetical protein
MKITHKFLVATAISVSTFSFAAFPTLGALDSAGGSLDDYLSEDTPAETTTASTETKVEGFSVLPGNGEAVLMWNPIKENEKIITSYNISYGKKSVEEAMADSYDKVEKVSLNADELKKIGVARSTISGLTNGEKYYFTVNAILSDGAKGASSEEQFTIPSLASGDVFSLDESVAITKKIVKLTFSKDVVLPEKKELRQNLFTLTLKDDEKVELEIEDVVLKSNYKEEYEDLIADDSEKKSKEVVTEDSEIYVLLEKDLLDEKTDYKMTISARLKDKDGNSIENGVSDNVFFSGTTETKLPESEKNTATPVKTEATNTAEVDPISALIGGSSPASATTTAEKNTATTKTPEKTGEKNETGEEEKLHAAAADKKAPEDVTNLKAEVKKQADKFSVKVTWKKSKNSAGDASKQLLSISNNNGKSWGAAKELSKDTQEYVFSGSPDKVYTIKVATRDTAGNVSKGATKTINMPDLIGTGLPLFVALGVALAGGGLQHLRNRRRKNQANSQAQEEKELGYEDMI